jgi:predicted GIY-YIG superfamily endonuclease
MNFRDYIIEISEDDDEFEGKTLKELELLLQHHLEDAKEYENSDETVYQASLDDIKAIKKAIARLSSVKKPTKEKKIAGNQNIESPDSMSSTGSQNMAAASPASAGPGQGNAE